MALTIDSLTTGTGEQLRVLATAQVDLPDPVTQVLATANGNTLRFGSTENDLTAGGVTAAALRFVDSAGGLGETQWEMLDSEDIDNFALAILDKGITILTERGYFLQTGELGVTPSNNEVRQPYEYPDAFWTALGELDAGESFLLVVADAGSVRVALNTESLAVGTNEEIRALVTLGDGAANELEYEGRDGQTAIGSIEGDNESSLDGGEGIARLRLRSEAGGRRVIVNVNNGQAQSLLTQGRSLFLYTYDGFIELPRSSANGAGGGFITWAAFLNDASRSGNYDNLRDALESGDRVLAVIADSGSIPNPYSLSAAGVAAAAVGDAVLSIVAADAVALTAAGTAGEATASAVLVVRAAEQRSLSASGVAADPVAAALLSVIPANAVSLSAAGTAAAAIANATLTVVQPVTRLAAAGVADDPVAAALLSVIRAGSVTLAAAGVSGMPFGSAALTVTEAGTVSLAAAGVAAAPTATAVLEVDVTDAERLIINQINRGKLDDLGDGVRPTPMNLVHAILDRKSGQIDDNVRVFPVIAQARQYLNERQEQENDNGEVIFIFGRSGGQTLDTLAGSRVTHATIEVSVYAMDWQDCQRHMEEALNALLNQRSRVTLVQPPEDYWSKEFGGYGSTAQFAVTA